MSDKKPRILFVDDEVDLLAGMRQSLRKERKRWELKFACGAAEAMEILSERNPDVVVTDMRMPGKNGVQLLEEVAQAAPRTLRFVLSGEASEELSMRAVPLTHQWMSKPCSRETLVRTIERALSITGYLTDARALEMVLGTKSLPAAPDAYRAMMEALRDPGVDLDVIADRIEADAALSARVLQMSNSSFFGRRQEIVRIRDAVTTLGLRLIADLVLASEVFESWMPEDSTVWSRSPQELQEHAHRVLSVARHITQDSGVDPATCGTAALIHDLGALVLERQAPDLARRVEEARVDDEPWHLVEARELGFDHAQVGAALLMSWGLPVCAVEAVGFHHAPTLCDARELDHVGVVHIANAIATGEAPDPEYVESIGATEKVAEWTHRASKEDWGAAA